MEPYHPITYELTRDEPTHENPAPSYRLKFKPSMKDVPEELLNGKEVEVQVDESFQIFGFYKHPFLEFDNTELDIEELKAYSPKNITIWF